LKILNKYKKCYKVKYFFKATTITERLQQLKLFTLKYKRLYGDKLIIMIEVFKLVMVGLITTMQEL